MIDQAITEDQQQVQHSEENVAIEVPAKSDAKKDDEPTPEEKTLKTLENLHQKGFKSAVQKKDEHKAERKAIKKAMKKNNKDMLKEFELT